MTEISGTITLSIDDDGFLRRECPNCEREFKWLHGDDGEPTFAGGCHCPYCGCRADEGSWWTRAQLAHVEATVAAQMEDVLYDDLKNLERRSKHLDVSVSRSPTRAVPAVPDEPSDMRRVDFACHPAEPVKVAESWTGVVHCLLCGRAA